MRLKLALSFVALLLLVAAWFVFAWRWSYSDGERAGWVQKFSRKGWVCKTWEGEQALVSLPGTASVEKFYFTVHDEATAQAINKVMGRRVNLHYEEKVGLPGSCFGETRYFVTGVTLVDEISLSPGVVVPVPPQLPASAASQ
ncbi:MULTISPECIES: hypothetical protein [unclassified Roseateles]|uniref:hypothetical protein n=1 Tax=unclassified Roseateles TaxID=2626991 RepID=UPI0006FF2B4F|nr:MULTISPECIES: hypothetical protein [unclassified Roseateles]KQW45486.1 hypothetical protein ASC81_11285 [Pelomonas sp. Root405]KRA72330.1 hypothetical protein ASD88_11285 [Pelomonas sp. Root662]